MSTIGYGYGSEWHLLWYLARHRDELNRLVIQKLSAERVDWLDFPVARKEMVLEDREWVGLEFLDPEHPARTSWETRWPQRGSGHNWDAVARVKAAGREEWLLVEAKAHIGEISSNCGAKSPDSVARIGSVLAQTKEALGVDSGTNWIDGYYQYCNRLAIAHHLRTNGVAVHLLFIYFTGDRLDLGSPSRCCPAEQNEWEAALRERAAHVGLPPQHDLKAYVHQLFAPCFVAKVRKCGKWLEEGAAEC